MIKERKRKGNMDHVKKGLIFTSKWFKGICVINLVDEEYNNLEVLITSETGQTRTEHWNLQNTIWGFEQGDYCAMK